MVTSRLADRLSHREFALTAEVVPPRSGDEKSILAKTDTLGNVVDAINITDGAGAQTTMSSLAASAILVRNGVEPVMQMTCRDRNQIALASDLLGAGALGIKNILMLRGDDPTVGDQPTAMPVFDSNTSDLLSLAVSIRDSGHLKSGKTIANPPYFFVGAADIPIDPPTDWKPDGLSKKIDSGAQFIQTQLCFDINVIKRYVSRLNEEGITEKLSLLIGLGPLASAKSARWMRDNLYGVLMPDEIIDRLDNAEDARAEGIEICGELLAELSKTPGVAGAHLMAPVNPLDIPAAIQAAGVFNRS